MKYTLQDAIREYLNGYFYNSYFFSQKGVWIVSSSIAVFTSSSGPEGLSREFEVRLDFDKISGAYDLLIVASISRPHSANQSLPATVSREFINGLFDKIEERRNNEDPSWACFQ